MVAAAVALGELRPDQLPVSVRRKRWSVKEGRAVSLIQQGGGDQSIGSYNLNQASAAMQALPAWRMRGAASSSTPRRWLPLMAKSNGAAYAAFEGWCSRHDAADRP